MCCPPCLAYWNSFLYEHNSYIPLFICWLLIFHHTRALQFKGCSDLCLLRAAAAHQSSITPCSTSFLRSVMSKEEGELLNSTEGARCAALTCNSLWSWTEAPSLKCRTAAEMSVAIAPLSPLLLAPEISTGYGNGQVMAISSSRLSEP